MKRLFIGALAALLSAASIAATLNPIQLLNPTGSSSGQAIVSTGASTAPAWGNVTATALAAQAANTVVANATGSSASPTAFAMPSCSTSASSLNWTSGAGFTCNTAVNAAQLAGQTFTSPTITTPSIVGVTNGSAAAAGSVGEAPTNTSGTLSLTTAVSLNTATVTLTAGDWDVMGSCTIIAAGSTVINATGCSVSSVSGTAAPSPFNSGIGMTFSAGAFIELPAVTRVFNVSSSTQVWTVCNANFSTSTATCIGNILARRRH